MFKIAYSILLLSLLNGCSYHSQKIVNKTGNQYYDDFAVPLPKELLKKCFKKPKITLRSVSIYDKGGRLNTVGGKVSYFLTLQTWFELNTGSQNFNFRERIDFQTANEPLLEEHISETALQKLLTRKIAQVLRENCNG